MTQTMVFNSVIEKAHKVASTTTKPMNDLHPVVHHEKNLHYLLPQQN